MDANRLALNKDKTKIFILTKHPDRHHQVVLKTGDKTIHHTKTINVLGIRVNEKLTWHHHLTTGEKSLSQQIRQRLLALRILTKNTSIPFAKQLANGLIMSRVEYAIALWGTAPKTLTDPIQKLINKAARIVLGPISFRWSIDRLMREMGWMKIHDLTTLHQSVLIHQVINTATPQYLHEKLISGVTGTTRSFANKKLGTRPRQYGQTMFTKNTFTTTAFDTYNKLPGILTSIPIKSIFKIRLKRYLRNNEDLPNHYDKDYHKFTTTLVNTHTKNRVIFPNTLCTNYNPLEPITNQR